MNQELRELMERWLRLENGSHHPCDESRFYEFVLAAAKSNSVIEYDDYQEIIESCRDHNANLTDEYLARHDFNQFEAYYKFCKFIIEALN